MAPPASDGETAPASAPQVAALPAAEPTVDEEIHTARDWALATQTAFATSRVDVAEPSRITPQDRIAANDGFHATPAPNAEPEDVPIAPASTAGAATAGSYGIDEDVFYTAQLASFRSAERARAGWQILKDSAGDLLAQSDAHIVRADLGPELGVYYRVRTGSMTDRAAATQFCQDLQTQGLDCMPVEASLQETNETIVEKICDTASTGALCGTDENPRAQDPRPPHIRG